MKAVAYGILLIALLAQASCTTCKGTIGVAYDRTDNTVAYTIEGSPAAAIGLQAGDVLKDPIYIPGEVGTPVVVKYWRSGEYFEEQVVRACVKRGW